MAFCRSTKISPLLLLAAPLICSDCTAPGAADGGRGDLVTTVYMTKEEALRTVFPDASRVLQEERILSPDERRGVEELLQSRMGERAFTVYAGVATDGSLDGYAVIQAEIGKFKPFEFIVGVEPDGHVRRVAVLVYREARGGEVAHKRFLDQYNRKTVKSPLQIQRDIIHITGATMSVNAMNLGVKKVLSVIEVAYRKQPDRLEKLLRSGKESLPSTKSAASSQAPRGGIIEVRDARYIMGSLCEIRAFGKDAARLRGAIGGAFREVEAADRALSDYRPESELSRICREGGKAPVPVSNLTAEFLELAARVERESRGAFDMTIAPAMRAWGLRKDAGSGLNVERAPTQAELDGLRPLVGYKNVSLSRGADRGWQVRLSRDGVRLDPGALGKGFAVDLAVRRLLEAGVTSALVDFSGNMYALGSPPGGDGWPVAVRDPIRPEGILGMIRLRDQGIASSGSYEKFVELEGVRYGHILSPQTLRPVEGVFGTTVTAPSAALADGCSTAAFVLGKEALSFLKEESGVEGLVVLRADDGSARFLATKGWSFSRTEEMETVKR
jgi:thiamine biosynthesis lipoprotein ApbE